MQGIKAVVLAGGAGERFWPRSRPWLPKQFLELDGAGSLIQQTYRRLRRWLAPPEIWVSTRADLARLVREHLPELPAANLVIEPEARNTAPSLGLAAERLEREQPGAVMVVVPADHVIAREDLFLEAIQAAAAAAAAHRGMVTLGVQPTRPETGYGYIQVGAAAGRYGRLTLHRAERFVEKPDQDRARQYLETGGFLWNAGIFAWQAAVLAEEIARWLPELHAVLAELKGCDPESWPALYTRTPQVSIDYGVLEQSDRVYVLPADFGWDDVGDWAGLARLRPRDADGNAVRGQALLHDVRGTLVDGTPQRVIAAVGVADLVIVDAEDAVLVCHRDRVQEVRLLSARARAATAGRPACPPAPSGGRVVEKPWGREVWWALTNHYAGKLLEVRAGHSLSLQYHVQKLETLFFQTGSGRMRVGEEWLAARPGTVVTLAPGTVHQLVAETDLTVIEVSTPHLDDVVRLEDRYGRAAPTAGGPGPRHSM